MKGQSVLLFVVLTFLNLLLSGSPVMAVNMTLSDAGLMYLDWYENDWNTATVVDRRDVAGLGVEFDIFFPGNDSLDDAVYYVSAEYGGAGSLAGIDISMYDNFDLKYTLVAIDGVASPDFEGLLVVGALIGRTADGAAYRYMPEVIGFASGQDTTAISSTTIDVDQIYQIGIHSHMLTPDGWDPSGSTVTLLVEAAPGAVPIPEPATLLLLGLGTVMLRRKRRTK